MKRLITSIVLASTLFSVGAMAQSAKFAATYTDEPSLSTSAIATCEWADGVTTGNCHDDSTKSGHTLAVIKVPQDKELLVGVSAEIGLMTFTSVKGKNGGSGTSVADAKAAVVIHACPVRGGDCIMAKPGAIKLSKRVQSLSAKLGGVIKDCTFTAELEGTTTVDISEDCNVNDEEIALMLDTTAAHHFNFVLPNMPQGDYEIKAMFTTAASADVYLCDPQDVTGNYTTLDCDADGYVAGTAEAASVINKSMLTVQTVRATKDGIVDANSF